MSTKEKLFSHSTEKTRLQVQFKYFSELRCEGISLQTHWDILSYKLKHDDCCKHEYKHLSAIYSVFFPSVYFLYSFYIMCWVGREWLYVLCELKQELVSIIIGSQSHCGHCKTISGSPPRHSSALKVRLTRAALPLRNRIASSLSSEPSYRRGGCSTTMLMWCNASPSHFLHELATWVSQRNNRKSESWRNDRRLIQDKFSVILQLNFENEKQVVKTEIYGRINNEPYRNKTSFLSLVVSLKGKNNCSSCVWKGQTEQTDGLY